MINRLIIRFSINGGSHRCLLIHRLSQRLSDIVGCRVHSPPARALNTAPPVCSARTLIHPYTDRTGFRSKGGTLYSANTKIIQMHT